jgi:acyl phosphate:glycerol-3-phosphate acyltransferase
MTLLAILCAYLVGSIPFALILATRWGSRDLYRIGSGNPGAANVWRVVGRRAGLLVAMLDIAKGAAGVAIARLLHDGGATAAAAGLAAVVGHVYPIWLRYRGGKGVATACGAFSVLAPAALLPALGIFFAGVWTTKYVSLGSVLASASLPALAFVTGSEPPVLAAAVASALLIVFRHRSNLARLRLGTEPRLRVRA